MSLDHIRRKTEHVFDLIGAGEHDTLQEMIHPDVRTLLRPDVIAETWTRLLADVGAKESYADTHVAMPAGERIDDDDRVLGTVVGVTTLNCEAGEIMGRVAVDEQLRVVGLLIVPPDYEPLPF